MGAWGPSIFSDDLALDIRREYGVLLSIGKTNEEVETMLIDYYFPILECNDPDEDVFWFALAFCEWKKGRLSEKVKSKALFFLENSRDLERWKCTGDEKAYQQRKKVLQRLKATILSPMPPAKKQKKPVVHHCPWKEGSLLAYRIISNKEKLENRASYGKYVLLRVVKIQKHPLSRKIDTGYYDESMLVGLYNWIGDKIPSPEIVQTLQYIPIERSFFDLDVEKMDFSLIDQFSEEEAEQLKRILKKGLSKRVEKCVWLDWISTKTERGDITFLDCDEDFCNHIPAFFDLPLGSSVLTHFNPFDITLCGIFDQHIRQETNTGDD